MIPFKERKLGPTAVSPIFSLRAEGVRGARADTLVIVNTTPTDRQEIRDVADAQDPKWQLMEDPDKPKDLFSRGMHEVEVYYDDNDAATQATHKRAGTGTKTVAGVGKAKAAAIEWLKSTKPDQV